MTTREMTPANPFVGLIPSEWNIIRLKFVANTIMGQSPDSDSVGDTDGIPFMQGATEFGTVYPKVTQFCTDPKKLSRIGDILMTVRAPVGKINMSDQVYCIGRGLCSIQATGVLPDFLKYYILKSGNDFGYYSNGTTYDAVTISDVNNFEICVPPEYEQAAIVAYLDRKCASIDEAIDRHKKIIEKLEAHRKAATIKAVTKGISDAKLVPSGEDWLGDVPCNWKVQRNWTLFKEINERGNDTLPILTVSINSGISDKEISDDEKDRVFVRIEDKSKYKRVRPGDIAYNMMRAWQGAFGAARIDGMVSPAYVTVRPIVDMDSRYYEYLMRSDIAAKEFEKYSRGITDFRLRLYYPEFSNVKVCVPPVTEQTAIADYLDDIYSKTDIAIERNKKLIEKLEEYRKSIIYNAVTGKIDCRKEAV